MAELLKGAPVAALLTETLAAEAGALRRQGIAPTLAILRVGHREDDIAYERGAIKRCEKVGIEVRALQWPEECREEELITALHNLNDDDEVHGVLLFRPLPPHLDDDRVRNALSPEKDVDGITDLSLAGVLTGTARGYPPCTAQACMEMLDYYDIDIAGKRAVVVGRSLVVGKPVAMMLVNQNATVTICHTRTADLSETCRRAEILLASAGRPNVIGADELSPGQVVIDVGINVLEDGSLCGDVDLDAARSIVASITPVPGGVGAVTTSVLAKHVIAAAKKQTSTQCQSLGG